MQRMRESCDVCETSTQITVRGCQREPVKHNFWTFAKRSALVTHAPQAVHTVHAKGNEKGGASGEIDPVICGQTQSAPGSIANEMRCTT